MIRTILIYGLIAGTVIILGMLAVMAASGGEPHGDVWLGYLIMLVALSSILVGVKQHRDQVRGGVIGFWPAFGLGVGIALAAGVAYVITWEVYLAMTDYAFMDQYVAATLEAKREAGVSGAAFDKAAAEMEKMRVAYQNPLFRVPMTLAEILPVGLLVALVSAALLRNPKFLPARGRVAAA